MQPLILSLLFLREYKNDCVNTQKQVFVTITSSLMNRRRRRSFIKEEVR
jgi:hypothetical protein